MHFLTELFNFLDIKLSVDGTDVYRKNTHTGQYTHFSSFEPFALKMACMKSLFHRTFMTCCNKSPFDKKKPQTIWKTFISEKCLN